MKTVTVSPKYQVVIPSDVREALSIKPGEKMQVIKYANRIELVPVRNADAALQAVALMEQGQVVDLDRGTALTAAKIEHDLKLPLADAVIVATARIHNAVILIQDSDLMDVDGVKFAKQR